MSSSKTQTIDAREFGDSFSNAGHYRPNLRAPFAPPAGMRWYYSTTTGQWHLEVK